MLSITIQQAEEQMISYGELHKALAAYTREDIHEDIPIDYYRRVIKACLRANNNNRAWDLQQAASILLYIAFNDGHLQPSQLNVEGLRILDWSERFLEQFRTDADQRVIAALSSA